MLLRASDTSSLGKLSVSTRRKCLSRDAQHFPPLRPTFCAERTASCWPGPPFNCGRMFGDVLATSNTRMSSSGDSVTVYRPHVAFSPSAKLAVAAIRSAVGARQVRRPVWRQISKIRPDRGSSLQRRPRAVEGDHPAETPIPILQPALPVDRLPLQALHRRRTSTWARPVGATASGF
jgi:hypothetical protein